MHISKASRIGFAVLAIQALLVLAPARPAVADMARAFADYEAGRYGAALKAFEAEADGGNAEAQWIVGNMLLKGEGVAKPDAMRAAMFYETAAAENYVPAQFMIGNLYRTGEGVPQDYGRALQWLQRAGENGHPVAQLDLGDMFQTGEGGQIRKSDNSAARWYSMAANQGVPEAQTKLGQLQFEGLGLPQDKELGLMWMLLAEVHAKADAKAKYRAVWEDAARNATEAELDSATNRAKAWSPGKYVVR